MFSLPGLLTFAALSLAALVLGVSLTRLVPGLGAEHPGILALALLLLFWSIRERWQRQRIQNRLLAEIDSLSEELTFMRGDESTEAAPVAAKAIKPVLRPVPGRDNLLAPESLAVLESLAEDDSRAPAEDGALLDAVRDALNNNRVELHVQPIVSLPQRRMRFFELLARPRDAMGREYQAAECIEALDASGLRAEFDALMLLRSVQLVRKLESRARNAGFFLNLSPAMLARIETFNPLYEFLQRERERAGNIVLEFAYEGVRDLDRAGLYRLSRLSALGFALSIDGVSRFDLDFTGLAKAGVRFVKFDSAVLRDPAALARSPIAFGDLREACDRHGIVPVLSKVESEADLLALADLDFPFGQGHLFGVPKLAKAA
ncbi:EAL domain-containing protein [Ferrovibrio xuzhouensis]|uniref:EAL domain-containing protein n=1 Tax=Ferrovibrio xuzhouensis TaxID=1576914 RepID=A0ABV7V9V4_9PROT